MKFFIGIALTSWFFGVAYIFTHLHAVHHVDHRPQETEKLKKPVESFLSKNKWSMVHYFDLDCGCSKLAIDQILKRGVEDHLDIFVLMNAEEELVQKIRLSGFQQVIQWEGPIDDLSISGVPLLTIYGPDKKLIYSGGYRNGSVTPLTPVEDMRILERVKGEHEDSFSLKAIGCHISKKYQQLLDPMGVKYGKN